MTGHGFPNAFQLFNLNEVATLQATLCTPCDERDDWSFSNPFLVCIFTKSKEKSKAMVLSFMGGPSQSNSIGLSIVFVQYPKSAFDFNKLRVKK